jgi:uncharacterized protein (TIGR00251 family)
MLLSVKVKPNSRRPHLEECADGSLVAHLKSPPAQGKANEELIQRLAEKYGVPKSRVRIKRGRSSRFKLVEIESLAAGHELHGLSGRPT